MAHDIHQFRYVATLCHTDDCCPQLFISTVLPNDQCVKVVDDSGNEAFFGPDSVLLAELLPMDGLVDTWRLPDRFGDEVYMQQHHHSALFTQQTVAELRAEAERRGICMVEALNRVDSINARLESQISSL